MAGGLLQIVSYGSSDIFLTGNPEITFFKLVYRRHTNFSVESIRIPFDDPTGFGMSNNVDIPKTGDLINKLILEVTLPEIAIQRALNQTEINELTNAVSNYRNKYNLTKAFLSVNMTAYRDAYNLYLSDNITNSYEIMNAITADFSAYDDTEFNQMIIDDYNIDKETVQETGAILFRYVNMSSIEHSEVGNISLESVPNYWDTTEANEVPKETTINIIYFLLENCKKLNEKYQQLFLDAQTALAEAYKTNYKFAWVDKLGHSIIEYYEFWIGGYKIDKQYGEWLDIWYELSGKKEQQDSYFKMIGNISELTTFDRTTKPSYLMQIPIPLWFSNFYGLALPLVALQYNDVRINFKFRTFSQCAYIEDTGEVVVLEDILTNLNEDMTANLLIDYIFLDSPERKKFAQSSHEYLIQQLQINYEEDILDKAYQFDIDLMHPCLGLVWILQKTSYMQNNDGHTKCQWTNYGFNSNGSGNPILNSQIIFCSYVRVENYNGLYFDTLQPYIANKNTPSDGINCYWFSLYPHEYQPTGECNMSRIKNVRLALTLDPRLYDNNETFKLTVFSLNYNVLRIIGGLGNVAYV